MKAKWTNILIITLLLLNAGTLAMLWYKPGPSHHPDKGHGPKGDPLERHLEKRVGFDDGQMALFLEMRDKSHTTRRQLEDVNRDLRKAQFASFSSGNIVDHSQAIGDNVARLERTGVQLFRELRELCTDEQLEEFDKLLEGMSKHMGRPPHPPGNRK